MKRSFWDTLSMAFVAVVCFWLGYQACLFNMEMGQTDHSNPFSTYTKVEHKTEE